MEELASEVFEHILSFLRAQDLLSAAQVCRSWNLLAYQDSLWKIVYHSHFSTHLCPSACSLLKFKKKYLLERNWQMGKFAATIIGEHKSPVGTLLLKPDGTLLSGGYDSEMHIYDTTTGQVTKILKDHKDSLASSWYDPDSGLTVTASNDAIVKVWDEHFNCIKTMQSNTLSVRVVKIYNKHIYCASRDGILTVYHMDKKEAVAQFSVGSPIQCLSVHSNMGVFGSSTGLHIFNPDTLKGIDTINSLYGWITCVQFDTQIIASGSQTSSICIWDVTTHKLITTLVGHRGTINCLQFDEKWLISGANDGTIRIWNRKESFRVEHVLTEQHSDWVNCMHYDPVRELVITGCAAGVIQVTHVRTGKPMYTIQGLMRPVLYVQANEETVASGSWDGRVRTWSFNQEQVDKAEREKADRRLQYTDKDR